MEPKMICNERTACHERGDYLTVVNRPGGERWLVTCLPDGTQTINSKVILTCLGHESDDGAVAEVCRRWNAHADLLAALRSLMAFAESVRPGGGVLIGESEMFATARAAIARAEGAA